MMNNCQNRSFLDEYLLGRLSDPDRDAFEEHFFNCKQCFRDVRDGQALLAAIRTHGQRIFADGKARRLPRAGWLRLLPYAFAGTAVLLAAWIGLRPRPQLPDLMPMTAPVSDAVRGAAVAPIAPLGSQSQAPSILDWSARSAEARIELPADVRAKLLPGLEYRWQVRAFAPQGGFLGASEYAVFRLVK
jgi:anti-sigma factor RsiW